MISVLSFQTTPHILHLKPCFCIPKLRTGTYSKYCITAQSSPTASAKPQTPNPNLKLETPQLNLKPKAQTRKPSTLNHETLPLHPRLRRPLWTNTGPCRRGRLLSHILQTPQPKV